MFCQPGSLLPGFPFRFLGIPRWALSLGQILPLTHLLRIVRGIMLNNADLRRSVARGPGTGRRTLPSNPRPRLCSLRRRAPQDEAGYRRINRCWRN